MLCAFAHPTFPCELFHFNLMTVKSQGCVAPSYNETEVKRGWSRRESNSDTDITSSKPRPFPLYHTHRSVKSYFPSVVLPLRVSISEREVNQDHALTQNPGARSGLQITGARCLSVKNCKVLFTPDYFLEYSKNVYPFSMTKSNMSASNTST